MLSPFCRVGTGTSEGEGRSRVPARGNAGAETPSPFVLAHRALPSAAHPHGSLPESATTRTRAGAATSPPSAPLCPGWNSSTRCSRGQGLLPLPRRGGPVTSHLFKTPACARIPTLGLGISPVPVAGELKRSLRLRARVGAARVGVPAQDLGCASGGGHGAD